MADKKPELLFLEAADMRGSGFILDGTENTPTPIELRSADRLWIPNTGFMGKEVKNSDGTTHIENVEIRYIAHSKYIEVETQVEKKVKYDKMDAKNDANKITMEKGVMTIIKTPSNRPLTDYLENVFWNLDAPNRPETAQALFKVVRLDKKARVVNEDDMIRTEAKSIVYKLQKKNAKGEWEFDEDKIDSYCKVLDIVGGDSYDERLYALRVHAEADPAHFVELILSLDSRMNTEVSQAVKLDVIEFVDGVAQFKNGTEVIKYFGDEKLNKSQQIERLADFLKTNEGTPFLTKIRAEVESAQNKKLSNK